MKASPSCRSILDVAVGFLLFHLQVIEFVFIDFLACILEYLLRDSLSIFLLFLPLVSPPTPSFLFPPSAAATAVVSVRATAAAAATANFVPFLLLITKPQFPVLPFEPFAVSFGELCLASFRFAGRFGDGYFTLVHFVYNGGVGIGKLFSFTNHSNVAQVLGDHGKRVIHGKKFGPVMHDGAVVVRRAEGVLASLSLELESLTTCDLTVIDLDVVVTIIAVLFVVKTNDVSELVSNNLCEHAAASTSVALEIDHVILSTI